MKHYTSTREQSPSSGSDSNRARGSAARGRLYIGVVAVIVVLAAVNQFYRSFLKDSTGDSSRSATSKQDTQPKASVSPAVGPVPTASTSSGQSDAKFVAPSPFTLARDGYVVKGSSRSFSSGEIDIELAVVFRKRPTLEKAYSILSSEVAGYVRQIGGPPKVEILSHAYVGDPEKDSSSWEQIKDTGHTYYVQAWFDARSNSIMKGRLTEGESIVSNVLAGAQADKASAVAKAGDEERAKKHEKNKLTTAAAGAQQLLMHLRDPESLKIESMLITDKDGMACIEYQARNGFGGVHRERAVYILLALITESDKEFATAWNHWCANMSGTEEGPYVSRLIDQGIIK